MSTIRLIDSASEELDEAHDWYLQRDAQVAADFRRGVDDALQRISDSPESYSRCYGENRRFILGRFPYSIIYRILAEGVVVIAVAHAKRRPFYWRTRKA